MRESKHRDNAEGSASAHEDRTEALLVEGLDRYFEGRYEDAIHLWTRLLFLDRAHARARAYISRARTALAERQRRADELLHAAGERLDQNALADARRILREAERLGGADERAAELWVRLDRTERARGPARRPRGAAAVIDARPIGGWRRRVRVASQLFAAAAFGMLAVAIVTSPFVRSQLAGQAPALSPPPADPLPLTVLSPADVALIRARTLYARGRPAEALRALDAVGAAGALETREVEQLRVDIQAWLLTGRQIGRLEAGSPP